MPSSTPFVSLQKFNKLSLGLTEMLTHSYYIHVIPNSQLNKLWRQCLDVVNVWQEFSLSLTANSTFSTPFSNRADIFLQFVKYSQGSWAHLLCQYLNKAKDFYSGSSTKNIAELRQSLKCKFQNIFIERVIFAKRHDVLCRSTTSISCPLLSLHWRFSSPFALLKFFALNLKWNEPSTWRQLLS